MEIEEIKKHKQGILEIENLHKRTGTTDSILINRIQEMEERNSDIEITIKEIDIPVKENVNSKTFMTQNIQEIWNTVKRSKLKIVGIEKDSQVKDLENIFTKIKYINLISFVSNILLNITFIFLILFFN